MSEAAVRGWTSRTEYDHSNDCPRKHHAPDCSPIVVFFEPRAIKASEDCPPMRSEGFEQFRAERPTHSCWLNDRSEQYSYSSNWITGKLTGRDDTVGITFARSIIASQSYLVILELTVREQRSPTARRKEKRKYWYCGRGPKSFPCRLLTRRSAKHCEGGPWMAQTSCSTGGEARQRAIDKPKLHTSYLNDDEMRVKSTVLARETTSVFISIPKWSQKVPEIIFRQFIPLSRFMRFCAQVLRLKRTFVEMIVRNDGCLAFPWKPSMWFMTSTPGLF